MLDTEMNRVKAIVGTETAMVLRCFKRDVALGGVADLEDPMPE